MFQSEARTYEYAWQRMTQAEFELTARTLATLAAIAAFEAVEGRPMPLEVLQDAARHFGGIYELDAAAGPSDLYKAGLVVRIGGPHQRSYGVTPRGIRRLAL